MSPRLLTVVAALLLAAAAPPPPATPDPATAATAIDALIAAHDLDGATALIERSTTLLPAPRLALARADRALAAGETDTALTVYTALAAEPTVAARAQLGIGLAQLRLGHDALAVAALDAATTADPTLARAWIARGVAADHARDWTTAEAAYAKAVTLDPHSAAALANRGYSQLLRGRFAQSAADSAAALTIDPKLTQAANNLRLARAMQGDYKTAFAGSTKTTLVADLNTVGFAAMSRGDYVLAETFFTRAMRLSPQFDRTAWDNLVYAKQLAHQPADPGPVTR